MVTGDRAAPTGAGGGHPRLHVAVGLPAGTPRRPSDEDVFFDPGRFWADRAEIGRQHLAFGPGIHPCLGATLARTEIDAAIGVLAERLPRVGPRAGSPPAMQRLAILDGHEELLVETGS